MSLSTHATRWLVAGIAAPILIWVILLAPPVALYILVAAAGFLAWWEYFDACLPGESPVLRIFSLAGWLLVALGAIGAGGPGLLAGLIAALAAGAGFFLGRYGKIDDIIDKIGRFALGHIYVSLLLAFILLIFSLDHGRKWILFALLVTFLGDTSAYYVGRTFGKRPLYPAVSPKKTLEGLGGNVLGCAITAALYIGFLLPPAWWEAALLGLFLGLWGAAGDLFESMLKRAAGVKDSGKILLGHGGILDRIDALLVNLPIIYFFALARSV